MELKGGCRSNTSSTAYHISNPFNGIERFNQPIAPQLDGGQRESIQWNWKLTSVVAVHTSRHTPPESIQWNWKACRRRLVVAYVYKGIHSMELKGQEAGHAQEGPEAGIHSMELKVTWSGPSMAFCRSSESIQWNWKATSPTPTQWLDLGIHSMELKDISTAPSSLVSSEVVESIQWNWKVALTLAKYWTVTSVESIQWNWKMAWCDLET